MAIERKTRTYNRDVPRAGRDRFRRLQGRGPETAEK